MWLLGAIVLVSGIGVVAAPVAVYSALFLTVNLIGIGLLFLTLSSQFMAVAQLLVYAGAVMVVFLFAVTVLAPEEESIFRLKGHSTRVTGLLVGLLVAVGLALTFLRGGPAGAASEPVVNTVEQFAVQLFGKFLFPFEGTAFLLLVALMAAVVLGKRRDDD